MTDYSEDALVEKPAIALFADLGWTTANCFYESFGAHGTLGRETSAEVVLVRRLRAALRALNPGLPDGALRAAVDELTRDRSQVSAAEANRQVYRLLRDGVRVPVRRGGRGGETLETVRVVDWGEPAHNDFFLASQFWMQGEMYKRRADLVGFVNGLPLVFVELKAAHKKVEDAYRKNLKDYKATIPQLFWYNGLVILSNGSESRLGSMTAPWEHFAEWKKIDSEGEHGIVSLETMLRGTCEPRRLLDLLESFTLFDEGQSGLAKLVAKNHQYLGVNAAVEAVRRLGENQGRLGVFWHTQGSGKSYSMVFFSQKVLRKLAGNHTFVIVTDRDDLDGQIYGNFAHTGVVTEPEERVRAQSGEHLRQLLREDHRYVFTLIQKFRTQRGECYPVLSERSDIIVMTDEAHRSQYDTLALNMRNALPNAAFIAFTGTPLMAGEEKTREVFGDYISIYNFRQSTDDRATVPLYYENRIPELQLTNENLNEDMERLLEEAELDPAQEARLERDLGREYHLITRDDRLEKVAEDLVAHFMGRGYLGKAMVVCIDKATAVRMYDRVKKHWQRCLDGLRTELAGVKDEERREALAARVQFMEETDMAVVVSPSQNEAEELAKKGADIKPHRWRMVHEDLDTKFKDARDPFRIVFVCAMWMTGFDAPCCSTIYLDKPMRNHTLMQTIARANRVFGEKVNGLIVDYVGVFRSLQKALAIYGSAPGGGWAEGEMPAQDKAALVAQVRRATGEVESFCTARGIDVPAMLAARGLEFVRLLDDAVDALIDRDETKRAYLSLSDGLTRLYAAILPDRAANEFAARRALFAVIAKKIRSLAEVPDISRVMGAVEALLDRSVAAQPYVIREQEASYDLSKIDFSLLRARFAQGHKHAEVEKLKAAVAHKLEEMVRLNRTRMDLLAKFQAMIDEYNSGAANVEELFARLVAFVQTLNEEDQRHMTEQLSEEELTLFDLLTRPAIKLTEKERREVKKVAQELLQTLKREKLVLEWRKRQQSRAAVQLAIEEALDRLPAAYTREVYKTKCETVYQHVYESYFGAGQSIYETAA